MTYQEAKRKIRRSVEDCLHNNNESIIFQTIFLRKLEPTKFYTKCEVILDLTDKQKEVLKNKLEFYAKVYQINANSWYFYFSE